MFWFMFYVNSYMSGISSIIPDSLCVLYSWGNIVSILCFGEEQLPFLLAPSITNFSATFSGMSNWSKFESMSTPLDFNCYIIKIIETKYKNLNTQIRIITYNIIFTTYTYLNHIAVTLLPHFLWKLFSHFCSVNLSQSS